MASYVFDLIVGQSVAFNSAATTPDTITLTGSPVDYTFTQSGSNLVISRISTGQSATLTGTSFAALAPANISFTGFSGGVYIGDTITGSTGDSNNNTISPAGNNSTVAYGLGGSDAITLGNGNNIVFGGSGIADSADSSDTLDIGNGSNLIYANGGDDAITIGGAAASGSTAATSSTVYGGAGNDSLIVDVAAVYTALVYGGSGADNLNLSAGGGVGGNQTIFGGNGEADSTDGADTIVTGTGSATIYGNAGNDTITLTADGAGVTSTGAVFAGLGDDSIDASATRDGSHTLIGNAGADTINAAGIAGAHTIYGGNGTADTTDGADSLTGGTGNVDIFGNAGNDVITLTADGGVTSTGAVYGGLGNDSINANVIRDGNHTLAGGEGTDTINGAALTGNVTIFGGTGVNDSADGADTITAGAGISLVYANGGADSVTLALLNDATDAVTVYGGAGNDTINTGNFDHTTTVDGGIRLFGGEGSDMFIVNMTSAGSDADIFTIGDLGTGDTIALTPSGGAVTTITADETVTGRVTLNNGGNGLLRLDNYTGSLSSANFTYNGTGNFLYDGVGAGSVTGSATAEYGITGAAGGTIDGGAGTDTLAGGAGADNLQGGDGNDTLTGAAGNDTLLGGADVDDIQAGDNDDSIDGGAGNDSVLSGEAGNDTILGGSGTDTLSGGSGNDSIDAGADNDGSVAGDAGNDTIDGGSGNDSIDGGNDNDSILGSAGTDTIVGGAGNDVLIGGLSTENEADTINGGAGTDTITGGGGADTFQYVVANVGATQAAADYITDALGGDGTQADIFSFTDLTQANLRGTGVNYLETNVGGAAGTVALAANVGIIVATNTTTDFTEANIYTALSAIADDVVANDQFYVAISNGTDSVLVRITDVASAGTLVDTVDTLEYVATFTGVNATELATGLSAASFLAVGGATFS